MIWTRMLAYITGTVDHALLLRNEYLTAENRIFRAKIKGRLLLSDSEKSTLAEIAHRLGRKALADVAAAAKPETLLRWYRELIARKFDGSRFRKSVGRPPMDEEIERLVVRMARENPSWGYDRIVGAMANLGYKVSDQTHAAAAACALAALFMQFSATANRRFWSGQSRLPEANYSVDTHDGPSALLSVVKPALEFDRALGAT